LGSTLGPASENRGEQRELCLVQPGTCQRVDILSVGDAPPVEVALGLEPRDMRLAAVQSSKA
jgi:hypothetical protein